MLHLEGLATQVRREPVDGVPEGPGPNAFRVQARHYRLALLESCLGRQEEGVQPVSGVRVRLGGHHSDARHPLEGIMVAVGDGPLLLYKSLDCSSWATPMAA